MTELASPSAIFLVGVGTNSEIEFKNRLKKNARCNMIEQYLNI